jgi:predicted permease
MNSIRWFRRLVRLFPAEFQADYAREMERTFAAQHRDATHEPGGVVRLWLETVHDLLRTAPREHLDQIRQDVRYASRTLARQPAFSVVATLVFALGTAATTAVFSVVQAALLAPIPFDESDRLVAIRELTPDDSQPWELSFPAYLELRRDAQSFEQIAAVMRNGASIGGREPILTDAALISANLLDALRVRPLAGRPFTDAEDRPRGPSAAIIREDVARARFGSPERAVGAVLLVDEQPATIVGVLPVSFRFPDDEVLLWLPIGRLADEPYMQNRAVHVALPVARLRDGVGLEQARAELDAWSDAMHARDPAADPNHRILVRSLAEQVSVNARPAMTALACAVVLLLVVTCSSVALLLLTRGSNRAGEVAIRMSLGASRGRIARQLVTEALCLALAGAGVGMLAAHVLVDFLVRGLDDVLPPLVTPQVDSEALAVALFTTGVAAVICGLAPAAHTLKFLRSARRGDRPRRALVAAQVATACILLVLATLLGRSLDRLLRVDLGFDAERLLAMRVNAPLSYHKEPGSVNRFYRSAVRRLERLPGVVAVTATNRPPVQPGGVGDVTIEGQPGRTRRTATYRRVLPGYFGTLGISVVEGRDFTERDGSGEPVVIVSRALARQFWPAGQAVGNRIKVGAPDQEPWLRIVGVVSDVRNRTLEDGAPDLAAYEPHAQRPWNGMILMIRTSAEPKAMTSTVSRALRELEPQVIISGVSTMEERIEETIASRRFHATVVGAFATATVLLVGLALYGVLASSVASRTREIGIRAAVGASAAVLTREVLVQGLRPALIGLALGLAGGAVVASTLRSLLFEVTPADVTTYVGTAALVLAVAFASSWLPARRAARIDPAAALRRE